jgi:hydroxymethylglutaryl-CoA lyase
MTAVEIVEVSPRDGLQNESTPLATADKVELVAGAVRTGVRRVEVTSFVRPGAVPQLADAEDVVAGLPQVDGVAYSALVLNERGYDRALAAGIREVNTVVITTDTFSRRNQGMSTEETLTVIGRLRDRAAGDGVALAVTVAASFGCPFEGEVPDARFAAVVSAVAGLGIDEISLADTIGVAVPTDVERRVAVLRAAAPDARLRVHLHDTRNTGIANAVAAVRAGVSVLDASLGGLGGCPFAPGASGNVATEDLIYLFSRMGIDTGLDLDAAVGTARWVTERLGRPPVGSIARVGGFPPARVA